MGGDQIGEAGVVETGENPSDDGVARHSHERADQRGPEWVFRLRGQVT